VEGIAIEVVGENPCCTASVRLVAEGPNAVFGRTAAISNTHALYGCGAATASIFVPFCAVGIEWLTQGNLYVKYRQNFPKNPMVREYVNLDHPGSNAGKRFNEVGASSEASVRQTSFYDQVMQGIRSHKDTVVRNIQGTENGERTYVLLLGEQQGICHRVLSLLRKCNRPDCVSGEHARRIADPENPAYVFAIQHGLVEQIGEGEDMRLGMMYAGEYLLNRVDANPRL